MHSIVSVLTNPGIQRILERHLACDRRGLPDACPRCGGGLTVDEREHEVYECLACAQEADRELAEALALDMAEERRKEALHG